MGVLELDLGGRVVCRQRGREQVQQHARRVGLSGGADQMLFVDDRSLGCDGS